MYVYVENKSALFKKRKKEEMLWTCNVGWFVMGNYISTPFFFISTPTKKGVEIVLPFVISFLFNLISFCVFPTVSSYDLGNKD